MTSFQSQIGITMVYYVYKNESTIKFPQMQILIKIFLQINNEYASFDYIWVESLNQPASQWQRETGRAKEIWQCIWYRLEAIKAIHFIHLDSDKYFKI